MVRVSSIFVALLTLLTGCATYEYDLVQPSNLQTHIGTKTDTVLHLDPLEYHLRSYKDYLVMMIFNPTQDPIELLGPQSAAIDPNGTSHPLHGQTIYPNSNIKLVFPPPTPYVPWYGYGGYGPGYGYGYPYAYSGFPYGYGYYPYSAYPYYYAPFYGTPSYLAVYPEGSDTYLWDWNDQTEARINLVFKRNEKTFLDKFVFHRVKM